MKKHIFARFALALAGLLFAALPSFAQAIWVNTPIHTNQPFNRALPMQTWECSGPQATLGTDMVEFLDTDGSVNGYVDCHGNIVGAASTTSWSAITNPTANLVLSMGTYNTAFEASGNSAFAWTWPSSDAAVPGGLVIANTTAATNSSARSSPSFGFEASYWDGSAAHQDQWTINSLTSSSTNSDLIIAYSGSAPVYSLAVPGLVASKLVDFSGATGLNLPATITAATPTTDLSVGTGDFRFDYTSSSGGASFINTTAAISSLNEWSPQFVFEGAYWTGSASAGDRWNYQGRLGAGANPDSTLVFSHGGSPGATSVQVPGLSSLTMLVGALPAASTHATYQYWVSDSTTIVTEGQTCVGSSTGTALAISNGSIWKCF